jgi:hypothetical protein
MSTPCNEVPVKFVNCCQVMDCIDIKSSDNSITVTKDECGVDLTINANNIDSIIKIKNGLCIQMVKEFIDGVVTYTPVIDWNCVAAQTCGLCVPAVCTTPNNLTITLTL